MAAQIDLNPAASVTQLAREQDLSRVSWRGVKAELLEGADELLGATSQRQPPVRLKLILPLRRVAGVSYFAADGPLDGVLVPSKSGFIVRMHSKVRTVRTRFTLAHELGHTYFYDLRATPPVRLITYGVGTLAFRKEEDICNAFAGRLLLPTDMVDREIIKISRSTPLAIVVHCANVFWVSPEVAARRLLHDFAVLPRTVVFVVDAATGQLRRWRGRAVPGKLQDEERLASEVISSAAREPRGHYEQDGFLCEWRCSSGCVIGALTPTFPGVRKRKVRTAR